MLDKRRIGWALALTAALTGVAGAFILASLGALGGGGAQIDLPPPAISAQIEGEVLAPGEYRLPEGGTIGDLVQLAGGFTNTADVAAFDFSLRVRPGERFLIPPRCLNINAATAEQFQSLPGVGPGRAADIVEHRNANGPFAAVENLTDVPGVGAGILANIQAADCVTVGE